jgi:hypothetical protein
MKKLNVDADRADHVNCPKAADYQCHSLKMSDYTYPNARDAGMARTGRVARERSGEDLLA